MQARPTSSQLTGISFNEQYDFSFWSWAQLADWLYYVPGAPAYSDTHSKYMCLFIATGKHTGQPVEVNEFSSTAEWEKRKLQLKTQEEEENSGCFQEWRQVL